MNVILVYFLGAVFMITAIHRTVYRKQGEYEMSHIFKLPVWVSQLIIAFEIIVGILLLSPVHERFKMYILILLFAFLLSACVMISSIHYDNLIKTYNDVFIFQPNFTSFILHITYLVILSACVYGYWNRE